MAMSIKLIGGIWIIYFVTVLFGGHRHLYASPIASTWIKATVRLENEWGEGSGTGFLVFREIGKNLGKTFLVTNKHVVSADPEKRKAARYLKLFANVERSDGAVVGHVFDKVPLIENNGGRLWREHEDMNVDVLAVDVSWLLQSTRNLHVTEVHYSDFIPSELIKKHDVTIADEVLIIGYPSGLAHARTNFPLVRQGLIATRIGEKITIQTEDSAGKKKTVEIPGFLVDATVIPGSSGSPVVLKPARGLTVRADVGGQITLIPEKKPYLLGIVSATKWTLFSIGKNREGKDLFAPALAGLGIVYDAETIKDTIEKFFNE